MPTKIEWCEESWNPLQDVIKGKSGRGYHCTKISNGCKNCFAETFNKRFGNKLPFDNTKHEFEIVEDQLLKPTHWEKPRYIFVQSMGDLFHPDITDRQIDAIFSMMTHPMFGANHHTYLILTKRLERILKSHYENFEQWKNIWLGVSVENQKTWGERTDTLRLIPAHIKFVSIEPMLEEIDTDDLDDSYGDPELYPFDWIIVGGESGPKARPMHPDWVRKIRDNCIQTGTPFFFKQWGEWLPEDQWNLQEQPCEFKYHYENYFYWRKVGKKKAGRLLDGREWNQYPESHILNIKE